MADEKIPGIMRDFSRALEAKDTEKVLSFFTDDGSWTTPEGIFKGKDEIRRFLKWQFNQVHDIKITEHGNGIIAQGNAAFYEHMIAGTVRGVKAEYLSLCAWEFKDDKIKALRTVNDRLSLARQVARGWLAKWLVSLVANRAEKGLR